MFAQDLKPLFFQFDIYSVIWLIEITENNPDVDVGSFPAAGTHECAQETVNPSWLK
jgi:hypothetical protein